MFWQTINFFRLIEMLLPTFLRKVKHIAFLSAIVTPLDKMYAETLYKMQHDGRTIYLEKMLNEHFEVVGYDPANHNATKTIYIEDVPELDKLYIYQDQELEVIFLNDDDEDNDNDIFLDGSNENVVTFSWIIFIPDTYIFEEVPLRSLVNTYRYFGKKYKIQTYEL